MKNARLLFPDIIEAAKGRQGCTASDVKAGSLDDVTQAANMLIKKGKLWKVRLHSRRVLFFSNPLFASDFHLALTTRPVPTVMADRGFAKDAVVVVPPNVKITVGPSFPDRILRTNTHSKT